MHHILHRQRILHRKGYEPQKFGPTGKRWKKKRPKFRKKKGCGWPNLAVYRKEMAVKTCGSTTKFWTCHPVEPVTKMWYNNFWKKRFRTNHKQLYNLRSIKQGIFKKKSRNCSLAFVAAFSRSWSMETGDLGGIGTASGPPSKWVIPPIIYGKSPLIYGIRWLDGIKCDYMGLYGLCMVSKWDAHPSALSYWSTYQATMPTTPVMHTHLTIWIESNKSNLLHIFSRMPNDLSSPA